MFSAAWLTSTTPPFGVVDPQAVRHRAEDRVETRGALGHHRGEVLDLAARAHLIGDVLHEDGQALRDAGETPARGGDDAVDVAVADGQLFVDARLARLGDLLEDLFDLGQHFRGAQADHFRVERDASELRGEVEEARVGELEAQLVRGDDGDADRRGLEHGLEADARIDFACGPALRRRDGRPGPCAVRRWMWLAAPMRSATDCANSRSSASKFRRGSDCEMITAPMRSPYDSIG